MSPRLPNGLLVGTLAACLWFPTEAPAQPAGVDAYGDPLPFGALARLGTQRFRHGSLISSLTFSPNGQALASLGADSHIRLWDFATGGQLWHLMTDGNTSYDFSPDGKHLAVAEGGWTLYLQEVGTDKVLRKFEEKFTPINDVRFSPDGQTLVTSSGQLGAGGAPRNPEVIQWSVTTGNVIRRFGVGQAAAKGKMLKSNLLFVWFAKRVADFFFDDLFTDEEEGEGYFQSAAFSPDGQAIAAVERHNGGRAVIRFWSTATGKELRHWGIADEVQALLFSPDGKTLATTGRFQPQIVLWDAATGKELRRLGVAQELLGGLAFSPDSKLLAAAFDHSPLVVWDVATGKEVKQLTAPGRLFAVAFSEDGKVLAAGGSGGVIHRWKTGTWAVLPPDSGHQAVIERVALLPGGQRTLSVAADGTLRTWDTATGREVSRLTFKGRADESRAVNGAALSPDGAILAVGTMDSDPKNNRPKKELIRLWQVSSGKVFRTFEIPDDHLGALTFAPGGKALAAVWHDGSVRVWDVGSGKEVRRFPSPHPGDAEIRPVRATPRVTFSPDGRLVVTREPPLVEEAEPLLVPDGEPLLAPDGGTLWYKLAERTTIRFRELASGKERRHFLFAGEAGRLPWGIAIAGPGGHGFVIFEEFGIWGNASQVITFSPDGKALALAGDQTIHLHHPVTGKELRRFGGFGIIAGTAAFSPDGKLLAAGTYDGAIFFWEVATGSILGRFRGHRNAVTALAFAADGKTLVSGGADTTALVWDVAALLQAARARPPSLETIRKRQAPPKRCSRRNQSKPQASWSSPR